MSRRVSSIVKAVDEGNYEETKRLLEAGADPNETNDYGESLLHLIAWKSKSLELAKLVVSYGGDVNAKTNNGFTVLMYSCGSSCNEKLTEYLLEKGADVNGRTKAGESVLHFAVRHNCSPENFIHLLEYGADLDYEYNGQTALQMASGTLKEMMLNRTLYMHSKILREFYECGFNLDLELAGGVRCNSQFVNMRLGGVLGEKMDILKGFSSQEAAAFVKYIYLGDGVVSEVRHIFDLLGLPYEMGEKAIMRQISALESDFDTMDAVVRVLSSVSDEEKWVDEIEGHSFVLAMNSREIRRQLAKENAKEADLTSMGISSDLYEILLKFFYTGVVSKTADTDDDAVRAEVGKVKDLDLVDERGFLLSWEKEFS